jgi:hypothetical protein
VTREIDRIVAAVPLSVAVGVNCTDPRNVGM